jgi:hypothetical protein
MVTLITGGTLAIGTTSYLLELILTSFERSFESGMGVLRVAILAVSKRASKRGPECLRQGDRVGAIDLRATVALLL